MRVVPNITHYFHVWHLAKGTININSVIGIRFIILGFHKSYWHWPKNCELLGEWIKSIINYMFWCAMSTPNERVLRESDTPPECKAYTFQHNNY